MLSNIKAKLITEAVKERDKYFTKDAPSKKKSDELIQATAATVGFFSEMNHHRKEKKSKSDIKEVEAATVTGPDTTSQTSEERASEPALAPTDLAAAFLNRHPSPTSADSHPLPDLITPVLIPQRRPNIRGRGFALAYAPILSTFDISQNAFLDFIITLNASIKPSPYLSAINLTSFACEASPEPLIGFLIGEAVETVTDAIMEVQSRMRSNDFLHKINDGFFMPRGLFAFVGMWRPNGNTNERAAARCVGEVTSTSHPQVNVLSTAALIEESKTIAAKGGWRSFQNQVHLAMLRADGEIAAIAPAPLLWPSAEEIAAAETPGKKFKNKSRIDRAGMWNLLYLVIVQHSSLSDRL
ncbi:hypothetical protein E8E12_009721 [Didymella heteroderae]|uniref:Uncharacterized protein n=1 Tax=Didymella heteroderae TaxID=1769908 RepID=A0A9P5C4Q9_9PLEO|nr:hypothetical protein E8E12_009721 [Didymella heteroderae]